MPSLSTVFGRLRRTSTARLTPPEFGLEFLDGHLPNVGRSNANAFDSPRSGVTWTLIKHASAHWIVTVHERVRVPELETIADPEPGRLHGLAPPRLVSLIVKV